ncbi:MAG: S-layer homology domain-containing protein [Eubacteriales bacterium]|nr:S-layer homology domain-containing protein [Eubacteriales bacterium]
MNNKIQKLLSVLVAVLLLVSSLPVPALAASGSTDITATVKHERTMTILPHPHGELLYVAPLTLYEGDAVEFTPDPDEGYALKSIVWYTDEHPDEATDITVSRVFTMPAADVTVKVEFAQLFTVRFDMQGHGSQVSPVTGVMDGSTVEAPASKPIAADYTFGGWYTDEDCKQAWNFGTDTVEKNLTLYAKWIENSIPKKAIGGKVTENKANVPGASVELFLGTIRVAATVTDGSGNYSFHNVENGTYNIVVTKEDGKTKTEMVTINDSSATVNVELPVSEINSKVEHKGSEVSGAKSDISQTVVGGLDEIAEQHQPQKAGDKVTIKLTVEPKADTNTTEQQAIKNEAGNGKKVEFLDLSLWKQVNTDAAQPIGDTNKQLLTIVIPFDFTGVDVSSVMILRHHGSAEKLTKNPAPGQEGYVVNAQAGTITLYAMKFSDYAIAFAERSSGGDDSGGGGGSKTPVSDDTMPFVDVAKNAYYYDAVKWAAKNGITSGTDATHFSPDIGTTRAQVVTFLWRTAGCPEPKGDASKFVDVPANEYYAKAVAWAIEQVITKGTSETTFSPDVVCTRGQIVTFLARFAGVEDTDTASAFSDVKSTDYFAAAVKWAKDNNVTNGVTETTFEPYTNCNRAQVVTFLYRYIGK